MVKVSAVTAVAQYDALGLDTFLGTHHPLDVEGSLVARMGVYRDRGAGPVVRLGDRAHHPLHTRPEAFGVDRALEQRRSDPGVGDALGEVLDEEIDHRVRYLRAHHGVECRSTVLEEERDVGKGVTAGGHHDV